MNAVNWFEILTNDFGRSMRFYETVLGTELPVVESMGGRKALFPADQQNGVGGCISESHDRLAGNGSTRVYLNVEGKLDQVIQRTTEAGGELVQARTSIAPHGYMAIIKDVEGNLVGLHSMS